MTQWTRTDNGLEAMINGTHYLIEKQNSAYAVWNESGAVGEGYVLLTDAKAAAEADAAADPPTPTKQGVHIDNIAGQQIIDILKRSFTTAQIQDFMDASPFDEPDTGAPEPQS